MAYVEGATLISGLAQKDSYIRRQNPKLAVGVVQIANNPDMPFPQILDKASELEQAVANAFPQERALFRQVDAQSCQMLRDFIGTNNGGIIIMRHGKQFLENEPETVQGADRKILQMRPGHNVNDPAEVQSLAEASAVAPILTKISQETKLPVRVYTSINLRASEVAAPAAFFNHFRIAADPRLNCVDYPDSMSRDDILQILGEQSGGALYWEKEVIDKICGEGYYDMTMQNMARIVNENIEKRQITLVVTHTPQMNAIDLLVNDQPTRVPELGLRVVGNLSTIQLPNSIFRPAA